MNPLPLQNIEKLKNGLIVFLLVMIILYFGRALFIPLSFSVLISFLLHPVCVWLEKKKVPKSIAALISISLLIFMVILLSALLVQQVSSFLHDWDNLKSKLPDAILQIKSFLSGVGVSEEQQNKIFNYLSANSTTELLRFFNAFLYSSGMIAVSIILIPLFAALILINRTTLIEVLNEIFQSRQNEVVNKILHLIVKTYYNFIKGMILVYFIVGFLNSLGLLILGIPHPFLFGFMASVLTFIPFVGIIAGSLLPISIAWITYNSVWYPIGVIVVFTIVQYLEANLIFPLAVSSRLKISSLATIISIIVGGIVWGTAGMILFVPFIAIIKLIADNFPNLKSLSLLLGKNKN